MAVKVDKALNMRRLAVLDNLARGVKIELLAEGEVSGDMGDEWERAIVVVAALVRDLADKEGT
jgi:hypothetical protein